ncbi:unnamed protein product [Linum tenue]|uniref:Reticulon domain-containing protein n=1 Tax=Linum tenue TaxID=586396 RepID=A0AAV0R981_9ROSI|nr:unnamed protein product [Linum tenue]
MSSHTSESTAPLFPSTKGSAATVSDIVLWRRPISSALVVSVATATWVLFEVVTVVSWVGLAVVTSLYLYGHLYRIFRKEEPDLMDRQFLREERVVEAARSAGSAVELVLQCLVRMSTNGVVMVMTLPLVYKKNEGRILQSGVAAQMKALEVLTVVNETVIRRVKGKFVAVASPRDDEEDRHDKEQEQEEKVESRDEDKHNNKDQKEEKAE